MRDFMPQSCVGGCCGPNCGGGAAAAKARGGKKRQIRR